MKQAIQAHQTLVNQINSQLNLLEARYNLRSNVLYLNSNKEQSLIAFTTFSQGAALAQTIAEAAGKNHPGIAPSHAGRHSQSRRSCG
ncbi:MAG: hypothetical protein WDM76_10370 [Limisphaerales bacterium]